MNDNKVDFAQVIAIGGGFMGFVIGSSFASGQEAMQYYTGHGLWGSIGVAVIALILYAWFNITIIEDGRKLQLEQTNKIFHFYLGKYLGTFTEWFTPIMLFMVYALMISASGSTFQEYYGINGNIGRILMIVASLGTVLLGLKRLVKIIGYISPFLLVGIMIISIIAIAKNPEGMRVANDVIKTVDINIMFKNWGISGLLYGAYTVTGVAPYLAGIGASTATSKKNAFYGGIFGGVSFIIAVLIMNFGLLANISNVYSLEIPSLYVADQISPIFGKIFSVMLILGIYTTAVPMMFTACNRVSDDESSNLFKIVAIVTAVIGFFGGQLSFSTMVGIIYPISGYVGLIIFAGMFYTKYIKKRSYDEFLDTIGKTARI
ncbi:MAG: hypothetical protein WCZ27_10160 [Tissierellaceae bacterium]